MNREDSDKQISGKRILVVDDEPTARDIMKRALAMDGHVVDEAPDGQAAWEKIQTQEYDRVLLDLKMPGMNGLELFGLIQTSKSALAPKVIFITGDTTSADTYLFLNNVGNQHIAKPIHLEDLRKIVQVEV